MSQPKITSQKPKPLSATDQNFSSDKYLPRSTPSMSNPPTLTRLTSLSLKRGWRSFRSMGRILPTTPGNVGLLLALALSPACDDAAKTPGVPPGVVGDGGVGFPDAGPPLDCTKTASDVDADGDTFSPDRGDCDDCKA